MKAILDNPYRILGLLVGASAREQDRQINRLKQYIDAEQTPPLDFSFPILGTLSRTVETVEYAASKLNLNRDKLNAALFWFYNGNSTINDPIVEFLKESATVEEIYTWSKRITAEEITKENCSTFYNLSTLLLWQSTNKRFIDRTILEQGIRMKIQLLDSEFMQELKQKATDDTFRITKEEIQQMFLNILQQELEKNDSITPIRWIDILSRLNFSAKEEYLNSFIQKPIGQIERRIEATARRRKANKANAANVGNELYRSVENELRQLQTALGINHIRYSSIADKVAEEILQCGIDYSNYHKENQFSEVPKEEDFTETAKILFEKAKSLAVGNFVMQRVGENVATLSEISQQLKVKKYVDIIFKLKEDSLKDIDSEINSKDTLGNINNDYKEKIVNLYKNMRGTSSAKKIITLAKLELLNIKTILKNDNDLYIEISTHVANEVLQMVVEAVNTGQKISTLDVDMTSPYRNYDLLKTTLKDAWEVTEMISSLDVSTEFQSRYLNNKNILKNICSQFNVPTPPLNYPKIPQLNFIIISSQITNTDENNSSLLITNPLYKKYVRYIGLKLNVESLEKQTVIFHIKYFEKQNYTNLFRPLFQNKEDYKDKLLVNSKTSPEGYTFSITENIDKNTTSIKLRGWGDSEECIYDINNSYRIEVYVNDFMIHKKEFVIELSPLEKLENQLIYAREFLARIKSTNFDYQKILLANDKLNEIKKFHWFRSSSTRKRQIAEQQQEIARFEQESENKKKQQILFYQNSIDRIKEEIEKAEY